jgi:hypothetical protein
LGPEGRANIITPIRQSWVIIFSGVLIRHLTKPAQHVPVVEFALLEIAGAAERSRAGMPQDFPLSLRGLYRGRGTCTVNGFTGSKGAVDEVKSQCHEMNDFGHECPFLQPSPDVQPVWRMTELIALVPMNSVRHLVSRENVGCAWFWDKFGFWWLPRLR